MRYHMCCLIWLLIWYNRTGKMWTCLVLFWANIFIDFLLCPRPADKKPGITASPDYSNLRHFPTQYVHSRARSLFDYCMVTNMVTLRYPIKQPRQLTICFSVYLLELRRLTASMWPKSMSCPRRNINNSLQTYFFFWYPSRVLSPKKTKIQIHSYFNNTVMILWL